MKKILVIFIITLLSMFVIGCNPTPEEPDEILSVLTTDITINVFVSTNIIYEVENKKEDTKVIFETEQLDIISLSNNEVTGLKEGNATVSVYLSSDPSFIISVSITVIEEKKPNFTVENIIQTINVFETFEIKINLINSDSKVVYETSDENIISINKNIIKGESEGKTLITVYLKDHPEIKQTFEIEVTLDPIKVFETLIIDEVLVKNVTTFGENPKTMEQLVLGSVCRYLFDEVEIIEEFAPIDENEYTGKKATKAMLNTVEPMKLVRPGILLEELKYIVYHDTGNAGSGADAKMHAKYMVSEGNRTARARSWHYTVDENVIYYQVPNNEITWQGDSYDAYAKSIGIETCINYGSDLYKVWQNTARLMSNLLLEKGLTINDIKQHYDMNGKNCPQTLRYNNLYSYAISLIEGELVVQTLLKDYEITFESLNPEYLDNTGKVIKLPDDYTRLAYKITFTKDNKSVSKVFYSNINGKCNFTQEEINLAEEFDNKVLNSNLSPIKQNEQKIESLVNEYYSYSDNIKKIIGTKDYLFNIEKQLLSLTDNNNDLLINEVYINNNVKEISYSYIELYNRSNKTIDLENYQILINNKTYTIVNGVINPHSYYLIAFGDIVINEEFNTYFPIPDYAFIDEVKDNNLSIVLKNNNNDIIDTLGINEANEYEDKSITINDFSLSINRKYFIDTNNNVLDFILKDKNPLNSNNEIINKNLDKDVYIFDYLVLLSNKNLDISNSEEIDLLTGLYNLLSDSQKEQSKKKELYQKLVEKMEGLKNPSIAAINKALSQIPNKIVNDFKLPSVEGVTYDFISSEGKQYYNIETGQYLKVSYEPKLITMIAYHGSESKEFVINFGLAEPNDKIIFNTGTVKPSGGRTSDGYGTYNDQLSKTGFCGVAIRVGGNIYFLGKNSLIELDSNVLPNNLSKKELRPYGGENLINNCGLVNGVPTAYKGTGALYYNSGDNPLTFDLTDTYGRNNSGVYGYFKIIFTKDSKGDYYVSNILPNSGTNETSDNYQVTLNPGEYLWCPHTYETNVEGGTWLIAPSTSTSGGVLTLNEKLEIIYYKK